MCSLDAPLWTEWVYVAGVAICGACPLLCTGSTLHFAYVPDIRLGDFRLHHRVYKKTQDFPWPRTHVIAPDEDLDPRLDYLFLHHADV